MTGIKPELKLRCSADWRPDVWLNRNGCHGSAWDLRSSVSVSCGEMECNFSVMYRAQKAFIQNKSIEEMI